MYPIFIPSGSGRGFALVVEAYMDWFGGAWWFMWLWSGVIALGLQYLFGHFFMPELMTLPDDAIGWFPVGFMVVLCLVGGPIAIPAAPFMAAVFTIANLSDCGHALNCPI